MDILVKIWKGIKVFSFVIILFLAIKWCPYYSFESDKDATYLLIDFFSYSKTIAIVGD